MASKREKLLNLANRAVNPTCDGDEEARTAAVTACKILLDNQHLLAPEANDQAEWIGAPPRRQRPSRVHPDAERLRAWRNMFRAKGLRQSDADSDDSLCADCGKPLQEGEPVIELINDRDLVTHKACAAWWWHYEPPPAPAEPQVDDDIPF
jgi:hypothetical protein